MKLLMLVLLILGLSTPLLFLLWFVCKAALVLILLGGLGSMFVSVCPNKYHAPKWRKR